MDNSAENQETPQEKTGKIKKNFDETMSKLTLVLGGKSIFAPLKLSSPEIQKAVEELAKEEKQKLITEFKAAAVTLIQKKREHDKAVAQLKKDFEKKEEDAMKKFVDEASGLFRNLENISTIEKDYYDTLMSAQAGTSTQQS